MFDQTQRLRPPWCKAHGFVHDKMPPSFLPQGLRTLVVAGKTLEEDDWAAWDARYQQAAADLEHRDELVRLPF